MHSLPKKIYFISIEMSHYKKEMTILSHVDQLLHSNGGTPYPSHTSGNGTQIKFLNITRSVMIEFILMK